MKYPFLQSEPTIQVALNLLGCEIHRELPGYGLLMGRIVETEAYLGLRDPSCHSFHGLRTSRANTLYLPAGHSYIYLIYGLHLCFNVVTGNCSTPEAVLVRALEPQVGIETMGQLRGASKSQGLKDLCNGPGKLSQALGLTLKENGQNLAAGPIRIFRPQKMHSESVMVSSRIGLSKNQTSSPWPLRFHLKNHPCVSPQRSQPPLSTPSSFPHFEELEEALDESRRHGNSVEILGS